MTITQERPTWARSAMAEFHECDRKLFLSRVSQNEEAAQLKKIKNRYLWSGAMVHDVIGDVIKSMRQGSPIKKVEDVISEARTQMRDEFKNGQLFEQIYNHNLPNEMWKQNWHRVEKSLTWFFGSPWFKRLQEMGPEAWKAVNEVLDFDVDGIKAYAKIDCALETEGRFVLIDWKTASLRAQDKESLLVSALYAHEVWDAHPEQMDAFVVSLVDGQHEKILIDEESLMETFMKIQEESAMLEEKIKSFDASAQALTVIGTDQHSTCVRCNFQKICYPGGLH